MFIIPITINYNYNYWIVYILYTVLDMEREEDANGWWLV